MQPLQRPTRLAERIDAMGLRLIIVLLSIGWFFLLWQKPLPALLAGLALALLWMQVLHLGEKRKLNKREATLRKRIGGQLAVDSLLLQTPENAAANVVAWLSTCIQLDNFETVGGGVLAQHDGTHVFCSCLQRHAASRAGRDDVLGAVRIARLHTADLCILCATCDFANESILLAEDLQPRTRLLGREGLIRIAGTVAPATNEQLQELGRRQHKPFRPDVWKARILSPSKAKRYAAYGLGMLVLFFFRHSLIYLLPAIVCLLLFYASKNQPQKPFEL